MLGFILVTGIGFGIAWWIASTGLAYWRSIAGFITAFIFSWIGGGIVIGAVLVGADGFLPFFDRSLLYAVFGAGWGVYQARARLKRGLKSAAAATVSPTQGRQPPRPVNDAFAEALSEIEESRLDKGVWARAFADAGGGAEKAKALYIKARAEALQNGEVWQVTQPSAADDTSEKSRNSASGWHIADDIRKMHPGVKAGAILVLLLLFGSIVSPGFRQGLWSLEVRHATEAAKADGGKGVATPPSGNPFSDPDFGKDLQRSSVPGQNGVVTPPSGNPFSDPDFGKDLQRPSVPR